MVAPTVARSSAAGSRWSTLSAVFLMTSETIFDGGRRDAKTDEYIKEAKVKNTQAGD